VGVAMQDLQWTGRWQQASCAVDDRTALMCRSLRHRLKQRAFPPGGEHRLGLYVASLPVSACWAGPAAAGCGFGMNRAKTLGAGKEAARPSLAVRPLVPGVGLDGHAYKTAAATEQWTASRLHLRGDWPLLPSPVGMASHLWAVMYGSGAASRGQSLVLR